MGRKSDTGAPKGRKGKPKRPWYQEGDWFAVPLKDGTYATGLIARGSRKTVLFGYFFAPRRSLVPQLDELRSYTAKGAILLGMFGDLGLYESEWPIIGRIEPWDRSQWPMPPFVRVDLLRPHLAYKTWYSEDDPNLETKQECCDPREAELYPEDGLWGSEAVQIRLDKLLAAI